MKTKKALSWLGTICFSVIGIIYIAPIIIVLINSFKQKNFISLEPFKLPTEETWFGVGNYLSAIDDYGFIEAVGWTVFITIAFFFIFEIAVLLIKFFVELFKGQLIEIKSDFFNNSSNSTKLYAPWRLIS